MKILLMVMDEVVNGDILSWEREMKMPYWTWTTSSRVPVSGEVIRPIKRTAFPPF